MHTRFEQQLKEHLQGTAQNAMPLPGHEERFETRLMLRRHKRKSRLHLLYSKPVLILAAASACVLIISVVMQQMERDAQWRESARLSEVSYEMSQVENFYSTRLSQTLPATAGQDEVTARLMAQLKMLESEYVLLEKKLAENFTNQNVIDAMVENYRYRLQIVEMIKKYIDLKNEKSIETNEQTINS